METHRELILKPPLRFASCAWDAGEHRRSCCRRFRRFCLRRLCSRMWSGRLHWKQWQLGTARSEDTISVNFSFASFFPDCFRLFSKYVQFWSFGAFRWVWHVWHVWLQGLEFGSCQIAGCLGAQGLQRNGPIGPSSAQRAGGGVPRVASTC